jgi:hypothetical protein
MVNVQDSDVQESKAKQSKASKMATFDKLKLKPLAEKTFKVYIGEEELEMKYVAISQAEYDKLVALCPPSTEDKAEGAMYDTNAFAPRLISAVAADPELTLSQARELWNSPDWSRGDLMTLFLNAVELCNRGFDVPFNGRG